jgi:hypothetical protein
MAFILSLNGGAANARIVLLLSYYMCFYDSATHICYDLPQPDRHQKAKIFIFCQRLFCEDARLPRALFLFIEEFCFVTGFVFRGCTIDVGRKENENKQQKKQREELRKLNSSL